MNKCEWYIPPIDNVEFPDGCILDNGIDICPYAGDGEDVCEDYQEWIDPLEQED